MNRRKISVNRCDSTRLKQLGVDFEIDLFETSLAFEPDNEEVLFALGNAYSRRGHLENGLEVDQRLVQIAPCNPIYSYNLACSLSLLDQIDDAFRVLDHAIDLGFDDQELLTQDPDLSALRRDDRFSKVVHKLRVKSLRT